MDICAGVFYTCKRMRIQKAYVHVVEWKLEKN